MKAVCLVPLISMLVDNVVRRAGAMETEEDQNHGIHHQGNCVVLVVIYFQS